jgi:CheY-like chemotaxis protein
VKTQLPIAILAVDDEPGVLAQIAKTPGLDLLITDLRMPEMEGYTEQSAAHIAGIDRGLPFVQKTFRAADLTRHVREALYR